MIRLILIFIVIFLFMIYSIFDAVMCLILSKIGNVNVRLIRSKTIKIIFRIFIFIAGVKIDVKGLENIDESEPLFVISNHRGFFDIIIGYILLKKPCGFVAKESLKHVPFLSYWMKNIDCLFLDRNDLRSGAMMVIDAIKKIKDGVSIWLCPEGTRNKNSNPLDLLEFKAGAFKIPEKVGCKILPVAFYGTEKIFDEHKPFIKKGKVYVNIGKMYKMEDLSSDEKDNIAEYNRGIIKKLLLEIDSIVNK